MPQSSARSWLAVDVGNSRVKAGLFVSDPDATEHVLPLCKASFSTVLEDGLPWDELSTVHEGQEFQGVVVGSNQHGVDRVTAEWSQRSDLDLLVVRDSRQFPIAVDVDFPDRVGFDRLLNAVAVNVIRAPGHAAIVVDCGTATTVDLVSANGMFRGGAILPGFALSATAMHHYTERLPLISIDQIVDVDAGTAAHPPLGRNTEAAMMSGVFWGQVGAIRELIQRIGEPLSEPFDIVLTGGGSRLLAPQFPNAIHCPYLPLQGLIVAAASRDGG